MYADNAFSLPKNKGQNNQKKILGLSSFYPLWILEIKWMSVFYDCSVLYNKKCSETLNKF